jgi:tetratricopeptide (TPR) repeat protein
MTALRRFLNTILALAVLAAAGGGCSKAARSNRAVVRADHFYEAGDLSQAEVAYSNAFLMVSPHNMAALRQLGFIYAQEGRPMEAWQCLQQAAKAEPDNAQLQIELAGVCASGGRLAEAKEAARHALKLKPGDEKALATLCDVIRGPEEAEQTRHFVEQLQKQDQDRSGYHLAIGMIDARETNLVAAETELNKARNMDPKSSLVYVALARLASLHKNTKGTGDYLKTAVDLAPLRSPIRVMYAEFQARTGATNEARAGMMDLMQKAPDFLPPLHFMMRRCFEEGRFDECDSFIARVLVREPNSYEALKLKAEVSLERRDGPAAVAGFQRLFDKTRTAHAQDYYQTAQAYLLSGDRSKAVSSLNRALELDTNYSPAAAIATLTQLLKQPHLDPSVTVPANLLLAQSYLLKDSPSDAIAIYHSLEKTYPTEAQVPFLEGQAWAVANNLEAARDAFNRSFGIGADYFPALEELVNLDLFQSRYADALERTRKQIDRNPKAPQPWLLLANIHLKQKDTAQAEADLGKVIELDPKQPLSYLTLARIYADQNQQKKALEKLDILIHLTNDVKALMDIGILHEQLKEYDQARQAYEKLLDADPKSLGALNNLACLYCEHLDDLDKAYQRAAKGRELYPRDPYIADTLGWILYKRHDYARALPLLLESLEKQPSSADIHYHAGMAHYMLGEEESARPLLRFALSRKDFESSNEVLRSLKILDLDPKTASPADRANLEEQTGKDPTDPVALLRLAALQEHDGEFEKAAASYDKVVKLNPNNARAIIQLAVLYADKLKEEQKGLELANRAHLLASGDPYISEALGRMVFKARDYPYALSLLNAADNLLPGQPDLLHDLAWAYFSVGKVAEARAAMQSALKPGVPFDKLTDARQFLEITAAYGSPAQAQDAARVQQVLQADAGYAPAVMASGLLQEQQGRGKEAEQSYEKVLAAYPLFVPATRQLAILYARDGGNDAKAYDYAVKAAQTYREDADLAKVVGLVEYRRKNYTESLRSLNQSAQKKQDDAELFWYLGMDHYQLKQNAEAKKALQQAVALKLPSAEMTVEANRVLGLLNK